MAASSIQEKRQLHTMVDLLGPDQVRALRGLVELMLDPVARAVASAPIDDEPLTPEEERALGEAREWLKHNQGIPHEQVLAELGITQKEVDDYKEGA
jgi:hypothetical protein